MVAETHTAFDDLTANDIVDFIVNTLARLDADPETAPKLTLAACGFDSVLEIDELAELVGEEYGERTLVGDDLAEISGSWTVADFVEALYPEVNG